MTAPPIVACVQTGSKYGPADVFRLQSMVAKHLPIPHRFVILTDAPGEYSGAETINMPLGLEGWWGKMALFRPFWRDGARVLYFDLDTLVVGDLSPLAALETEFGIPANFTRASGEKTPCKYGSCVMTIAPHFGAGVWREFERWPRKWINEAGPHGDQWVIQLLAPDATLLQGALPHGFFLGYREMKLHQDKPPPEAALVIYAGGRTPENFGPDWARDEWRLHC